MNNDLRNEIEKAWALFEELDLSPPRAKIALAGALFEERLNENLLRRFTGFRKAGVELDERERPVVEAVVPQSAKRKAELAFALGIFSLDDLAGIGKALGIRNRAVHRTSALNSHDTRNIEDAASYLRQMAEYLALGGAPKTPKYPIY